MKKNVMDDYLGDLDVIVEYEYQPERPSWFTPGIGGHPGDAEEVTLLRVCIGDEWIDADNFSAVNLAKWKQAAIEHEDELRQDLRA